MRKLSIESSPLDQGRAAFKRNAATMALAAPPETEVLIVAECWAAEADAEAIVHRAIETAAAMLDADTGDAELAVMLTDDSGIRTLNKNWRGQD